MDTEQLIYLFLVVLLNKSHASDFPGFQSILNFFGSDFGKNNVELGQSRGVCNYNFLDYVTYAENRYCVPDDKYILHLLDPKGKRKPPIRVKCLQPEPSNNISAIQNSILMMESVKDIVALLKPVGNATKRHEPGSCVLVIFYTDTSLACARWAPMLNSLPGVFPTLRIAAIDALRFSSFNTDFGIVDLPTLLLFHQGRPVVRYYNATFLKVIDKHTGIKPAHLAKVLDGPLPTKPLKKRNNVLILAWVFIMFCIGNYFTKSRLCHQIIEMIKRNWRESEAQLEM